MGGGLEEPDVPESTWLPDLQNLQKETGDLYHRDIHTTNVGLNFVTKIEIKCQNRINVIPILLEIIFREVE